MKRIQGERLELVVHRLVNNLIWGVQETTNLTISPEDRSYAYGLQATAREILGIMYGINMLDISDMVRELLKENNPSHIKYEAIIAWMEQESKRMKEVKI